MRIRFYRSSMHVITILMVVCFLASNLVVVRAQTTFDETKRIIGFWQRIGYPSIAEDAVRRIVQSGDAAIESYVKFHSQKYSGCCAVRCSLSVLIEDRNDIIKAGLQKGLEEHPPVLVYQTERDTIALMNVEFDFLKYPRYSKQLEQNPDSLITFKILNVCKHYLTADGKIIRRNDHDKCPLNYQIYDEAYNWRPDDDNGMVVPINNVLTRQQRSGGDLVQRRYLTRLLPAPGLRQLVDDLQRLNEEIDTAFIKASRMFDQLLYMCGSSDFREDNPKRDGRCGEEYGIPIRVRLIEDMKTIAYDTIYTYLTYSRDQDFNWDRANHKIVRGKKYENHWIHKSIGLGSHHRHDEVCSGNLWGKPTTNIGLLNIPWLGKRLFALNQLSRITDNSFRLAKYEYASGNIDSLSGVVKGRRDTVLLLDKFAAKLGSLVGLLYKEYVDSKAEAPKGAQLIQSMGATTDTTTYFGLVHSCSSFNNKSYDIIESIASLVKSSVSASSTKVVLGAFKQLGDTMTYQPQVSKDSSLIRRIDEITQEIDSALRTRENPSIAVLRSQRDILNLTLGKYRSQVVTPSFSYRLLNMRGACSDNHVLDLFAVAVRENRELLEHDEDDVVDTIMARHYLRYINSQRINRLSEDEIDDLDDSVESYQDQFREGTLFRRIVDMPGDVFNLYNVDYVALGNALEKYTRMYLDTIVALRNRYQNMLRAEEKQLEMAERFRQLQSNVPQSYPTVFDMRSVSKQYVQYTNYLGQR